MSVGYRTYGFCDGVYCTAVMDAQILHNDLREMHGLAVNMRELAVREGWTREGDRDYCPECSERRAK